MSEVEPGLPGPKHVPHGRPFKQTNKQLQPVDIDWMESESDYKFWMEEEKQYLVYEDYLKNHWTKTQNCLYKIVFISMSCGTRWENWDIFPLIALNVLAPK